MWQLIARSGRYQPCSLVRLAEYEEYRPVERDQPSMMAYTAWSIWDSRADGSCHTCLDCYTTYLCMPRTTSSWLFRALAFGHCLLPSRIRIHPVHLGIWVSALGQRADKGRNYIFILCLPPYLSAPRRPSLPAPTVPSLLPPYAPFSAFVHARLTLILRALVISS